jgi:hypothetical protein
VSAEQSGKAGELTALTWNNKAMCVTCGRSDQGVRYHHGHVISRALMKGSLIWLNAIARANREPEYRDNESWNIVCQCAPCNNATYDRMAAINHPSNEKQALWKALHLHQTIYLLLQGGLAKLTNQAVHEALCKLDGKEVDEAEKTLLVDAATDEGIEAIGLIKGANDLATLRQWYAELQEPS